MRIPNFKTLGIGKKNQYARKFAKNHIFHFTLLRNTNGHKS